MCRLSTGARARYIGDHPADHDHPMTPSNSIRLETASGLEGINAMPRRANIGGLSIPRPEFGSRVVSGTFRPRNLSYVVSEELDFITTSTDWVPVPHMSVTFELSRKRRSDIITIFTAMCGVEDPTSLQVRTKLDGELLSFPDEIQFSGMIPKEVQDWGASCHSYPFVFQKVSRGSHTVIAEFRGASALKANLEVIISRPSLVVVYA